MMSILSTMTALAATLTLTAAAPVSNLNARQTNAVTIVLQLAGFDAASTLQAQLDRTTPNNRDAKSAALQQAGPWCAGFSDSQATRPVPALNGDGIFDSANEAIYAQGDDAVPVGSFWCAATRGEVEDFVARAVAGNGNGNDNANNNNNNANNNANQGGNANAGATVRVQIELERDTTFVQAELPANVGRVNAANERNLQNGAFSIDIVGAGSCDFFDANGRQLQFGGNNLERVAQFECRA